MPQNKTLKSTQKTEAKSCQPIATQRVAKYIATAGICSRREAERLIEAGKVKVNGEVIPSPALNVTADDMVEVSGKIVAISNEKPRVFALHKPRGYLCTSHDPHGRPTVFDLLPKQGLPRLIMVGRLDFNSEGLLLFTTSNELATQLMSPKSALKRVYQVRVDGKPDDRQIAMLKKGVTVDGIRYKGVDVELKPQERLGRNRWLGITLTEGKNREIRKLMDYCGLHVSRLIRTEYANFHLIKLPKAHLREESYRDIEKVMRLME